MSLRDRRDGPGPAAAVGRLAFLLMGLGLALGMLASYFATKLLTDSLIDVARLDRQVLVVATLLLSVVSMVAAVGPALQAARVDPMRKLRQE